MGHLGSALGIQVTVNMIKTGSEVTPTKNKKKIIKILKSIYLPQNINVYIHLHIYIHNKYQYIHNNTMCNTVWASK